MGSVGLSWHVQCLCSGCSKVAAGTVADILCGFCCNSIARVHPKHCCKWSIDHKTIMLLRVGEIYGRLHAVVVCIDLFMDTVMSCQHISEQSSRWIR